MNKLDFVFEDIRRISHHLNSLLEKKNVTSDDYYEIAFKLEHANQIILTLADKARKIEGKQKSFSFAVDEAPF